MFNLTSFISSYGSLGVGLMVFVESSIFPFLPGDSLLFTAGFLASQKILPIWVLFFMVLAGAVLGNTLGYTIGRKHGVDIFSRQDSFFLRPEHIEKTRLFFQKHGPKAIVIARFVPIVRTFIPLFAGVGKMPFVVFMKYNIIGAIIWCVSLIWSGYYLSRVIPGSEKYIGPVAILIIIISILPSFISFVRVKKNREAFLLFFRKIVKKIIT